MADLAQETHDAVIEIVTRFDIHIGNEEKILRRLERHDELLRGKNTGDGLCARVNSLERWKISIKTLWGIMTTAIIAALANHFYK